MGQILDAKPILMFDHISQYETKGVSLHHLVKLGFVKRDEVWRKEEPICRILSEDLYSPHLEHFLNRGRIFYRSIFDRFNLFGKVLDFPLKGS